MSSDAKETKDDGEMARSAGPVGKRLHDTLKRLRKANASRDGNGWFRVELRLPEWQALKLELGVAGEPYVELLLEGELLVTLAAAKESP